MSTASHSAHARPSSPSGTVTFLFSDVEGSTQRWERDSASMERAVRRHDGLMRSAITARSGTVFKTVGDAFCAAFSRADDAVAAACDAQHALSSEDFSAVDGLSVRMALHSGSADERDGDYFGPAVNRTARLLAIAHGGQILVSGLTRELIGDRLPSGAALVDLGEHRLKDLARVEHVYQLVGPGLRSEFPQLRSLESSNDNLPLQVTSFIGRDREIAEIAGLLQTHRLVTLTGSGGVGKTSVSLHVAASTLETFSDGVWFVDLSPLSDGEFIPSTVAAAIGFKLAADGNPLDVLVGQLRSRGLLLILDNCEHLIDAAARVASAILRSCPRVIVLATSRQELGIAGEVAYRVPSLAVPDERVAASLSVNDAMHYDALALLIERSQTAGVRLAVGADDVPVLADICRRLDGIPLAIELAAARLRVFGPREVRQRLDESLRLLTSGQRDAMPRQRTLRALIDWSYNLLDNRERTLFDRSAVFVDGFTLEAASAVVSDETLDAAEVFDGIASLSEKSLLVPQADTKSDDRYRLLESTRAYALEKLTVRGERDSLAARHLHHFRQVATQAQLESESSGSDAPFQALRAELGNIRAALGWSAKSDV